MKRRELLRLLGSGAVPALIGVPPDRLIRLAESLHARAPAPMRALSPPQATLVSAVADLILPRTETPGALDVGAPAFADLLLAEWYPDAERENLERGMAAIDEQARAVGGSTFAELSGTAKANLARALDTTSPRPAGSAAAAFRELKGITIYGYFTSEPVMTDVLKYPVIPGRYGACEHV